MSKVISMSEMSIEIGVNKSKLSYYVTKGVLIPDSIVSGMYLFDKANVKKTLALIEKHQEKGLTLKEIKVLLKQKKVSKK